MQGHPHSGPTAQRVLCGDWLYVSVGRCFQMGLAFKWVNFEESRLPSLKWAGHTQSVEVLGRTRRPDSLSWRECPPGGFRNIHIYLCSSSRSQLGHAGSFSCGMWPLRCSMWDLVPWPGMEPGPPALRALSLCLWTTGEVLALGFLNGVIFSKEVLRITSQGLYTIWFWVENKAALKLYSWSVWLTP